MSQITWNGTYHPKPTFVHIRDDGSIGLEWCTKHKGRVAIEFDDTKDQGDGESNMYAIYTRWENEPRKKLVQEILWIHSPSDVMKALSRIGLEPK